MYTPFIQLLQVALGSRDSLSRVLSAEEWDALFNEAQKQAIVGVLKGGIERLPKEQIPPQSVLLQWIGLSLQIESQNSLLNQRCLELQQLFYDAGFAFCILKGQGNALYYPKPEVRQSGDIDIWVRPIDIKGKRVDVSSIVEFLGTKCNIGKHVIGYHHVESPLYNDVEIEVHWRPSWKSSPLHNWRMQRWLIEQSDVQFNHIDEKSGLHVPTWEFNVVYLLQHMYLHIFQEGLGLRQVVDYFYLLKSDKHHEIDGLVDVLKYLDLYHFAGAIMYVLREALGMEEKYLLVPVDDRRGEFLLEEIMLSGNFGRYDERNRELSQRTGISRSLARFKRQYRFLRDYPVEVLCAPFQIYHVIWRKLKFWRWE